MKKRILTYTRSIDALLETQEQGTDWQAVRREHLIQIGFFQHERLVHLIVTVTFAVLEMLAMCLFVYCCGSGSSSAIGIGVLCMAFLVLLIPYIRHYYLLENQLQKMYGQYDRMAEKINE